MTLRKIVRPAVGASVALFFFWMFLRQVQLQEIKAVLAEADTRWVLAALGAFACGYASRIERWRKMLELENSSLRWSDCAGPFLASFAMNNVVPLRAGDVLRTFAFNNRLGTTAGAVVATLLVERLLDLLLVLVLLGISLGMFPGHTVHFAGIGAGILLGIAAALILLLLRPDVLAPAILSFARLVTRISPRIGARLGVEIEQGLATMRRLAGGDIMARLILWSVAAWLAEGCVYWFAALSLPSVIAPLSAWFALPVSALATLIPSTPGYAGTFDYFAARSMIEFQNPAAAAAAFALLVHALLWVPPTIIGGLYLLMHPSLPEGKSLAIRS